MKDPAAKVRALKPFDAIIVHAALIEARRLMVADLTPNEAAEQACRGAWYVRRGDVARRLAGERGIAVPSRELPDAV